MAATSSTAGSVATIGALTNQQREYFEPLLLDRAVAQFFYCPFALVGDVPAGHYKYEWQKVSALSAATTPLTEGVTPASEALTINNYTLEPLQYGSYIRHSDKLDLQNIHDLRGNQMVRLLGEQCGLTADTLARDAFTAGGTAQIADGTAARGSLAATNLLDAEEISKAYATLLNNNARGWDFLGGRFACIISAYAWHDLMRDAELRNALSQAADRSEEHPFWTGEVHDYMRVRFFITSNAKYVADAGASAVDVYLTMVIGRDAFGIGGMGGHGFRPDLGAGGTGMDMSPPEIYSFDAGSVEDPLAQRASVGWKGYQQEAELNSSFSVRIEHACSMGANT